MPIRVLEAHTAELIAAGEVVERPASVVKELVENAIDAGAKHLEVEIEQGGVRLIRVQDDGCGILADEVPIAFLRHATSKVWCENDLDSISTLGFRGEALASIASVSKVELLTREKTQEDACLYRIEGGVEYELCEAARPYGTTFYVRELFFNTPARMKFLKKDASEAAYVTELVGRLALSCKEVSLRYLRDGKEVFHTPGTKDLTACVYAVLGKEFAKGLCAVDYDKAPYGVTGLVTFPKNCRKSRSMQYFYINGRFVKSRTMMAALEQAYRGKTMHGKFPGCVLFLTLPLDLVDVNVHPAKTEVRFAHETAVFSAVYTAVKEALEKADSIHTTMQFSKNISLSSAENICEQDETNTSLSSLKHTSAVRQTENVQTLFSSEDVIPYRIEKQPKQPGFLQTDSTEYGLDIRAKEDEFSLAYIEKESAEKPKHVMQFTKAMPVQKCWESSEKQGDFTKETTAEGEMKTKQLVLDEAQKPELCYVGELFSTYVLAQSEDTLYVIDKHAAHERLLYEKLAKERKGATAQMLLCPVAVTLGAEEKAILLENEAILRDNGIELEEFGGADILVRAVPGDIVHEDVEGLLVDVASGLLQGGQTILDEKTEWVLHSMACRAAIKGGDKTAPQQLLYLAQQIMDGTIPPFCPHGRPVVLEITRKELEKQFGRLG